MYAMYVYEVNPNWAEDYDDGMVIAEDESACYEALRNECYEPEHITYANGREFEAYEDALVFLFAEMTRCTEREAREYLTKPDYRELFKGLIVYG